MYKRQSPNSASGKVDESVSFSVKISPEGADNQEVSWSSSNNSVATVENGTVKFVGVGSATISVVSKDNDTIKATADVTVSALSLIHI